MSLPLPKTSHESSLERANPFVLVKVPTSELSNRARQAAQKSTQKTSQKPTFMHPRFTEVPLAFSASQDAQNTSPSKKSLFAPALYPASPPVKPLPPSQTISGQEGREKVSKAKNRRLIFQKTVAALALLLIVAGMLCYPTPFNLQTHEKAFQRLQHFSTDTLLALRQELYGTENDLNQALPQPHIPASKKPLPFLALPIFSQQSRLLATAPLQYTLITSPYGMRWGRLHQGVDLAAASGSPVYASQRGRVVFSGWQSGYGKMLVVDHGHGLKTRYAHCSRLLATRGAIVQAGQTIGRVGSTGHSTGPHLHFELLKNGTPMDPQPYLREHGTAMALAQ